MFAKLLTVVAFVAAIGAALLGLRQQRLQIMHDMARLHTQMSQSRQNTWDYQVRIAQRIETRALRSAAERSAGELAPLSTTEPRPIDRLPPLAEHDTGPND